MHEVANGSKYSGKFTVDGKEIDGELTFDGANTNLLLHHSEFFRPDNIEDQCVHGILRDLTRVSLLQCLAPGLPASHWSAHLGSYQSAQLRPHFVLYGSCHVGSADKAVRSISLILKDGPKIFQDYRSFSIALNANSDKIRSLIREETKASQAHAAVGKRPIIAYFAGKEIIFQVNTVIGRISIFHTPTYDLGGPSGVFIENRIITRIAFPKLVNFQDAIDSLGPLLSFFAIVAGRRQELADLSVQVIRKKSPVQNLQVYWCRPPVRQGTDEEVIADLPIDIVREPKKVSKILIAWLVRHDEWKDARNRFLVSFSKENMFDLDRLVGSANMFDLLPASSGPAFTQLSAELQAAKEASKSLFKALPESIERSSMLNALGRLGHASLKEKVRHRAKLILDVLGSEFPHLIEVLDLAVDARNHFVHGTKSKIDYSSNFFQTVAFFSKALEFVFAVSDLLEAGWDVHTWHKRGMTATHPFARFVHGYHYHLRQLKAVLPEKHPLTVSLEKGIFHRLRDDA